MKKNYIQPATTVVCVKMENMVAQSVHSLSTNLGEDATLNYGGGGSSAARVKTNTVDWDDDWSE